MRKPHLPPSLIQQLLFSAVPAFMHHTGKQRVVSRWSREGSKSPPALGQGSWQYFRTNKSCHMMESGSFVKAQCSRTGMRYELKGTMWKGRGAVRVWAPCVWCKSCVEGHIFMQRKNLILQWLRQPLRAGIAVYAVHMHRNAHDSINNRIL